MIENRPIRDKLGDSTQQKSSSKLLSRDRKLWVMKKPFYKRQTYLHRF